MSRARRARSALRRRQAARLFAISWRIALIAVCILALRGPRLSAPEQAITQGDSARQNREYGAALTAYQGALRAQPSDPVILRRLIDTAISAHRLDTAIIYVRRLAAIQGWTAGVNRTMGDLLTAQGDRQQAMVYWQAALTGSPTDLPMLKQLALAALNQGDWDTATTRFRQALALAPTDSQTLYQLGLLLSPTDQVNALVDLNLADQSAYQVIGSVFHDYGGGSVSQVAFHLGLEMLNLGAWPQAEHTLLLANNQGPENPAALALLGLAQDRQGHDGWPSINRASTLAPDDSLVAYALAVHWRLTGELDKAIEVLSRAGNLDPTNAAIAGEMGLTYRAQGRLADAAQWLNTAAGMAPNDPHFRTLLATFYADENYDLGGEGLAALQQLAAKSPTDPDVQACLGWALLYAKQIDAAQPVLEKALTLNPDNPRTRYYVAILRETRGNLDSAITDYLYVFQNSSDPTFKALANRALTRLNYQPPLGDLVGNFGSGN